MHTHLKMDRPAIVALCVALTGCAGLEPTRYAELESAAHLAPNPKDTSGRVPYRYSTPVDWRNYNKIIVEPVAIYRGADHQFGDMSEEGKADLAAYMGTTFAQKLATRFMLTTDRGPRALRLKLTLTGAVANTPVLGTLSRFDMAGALYNGVQTVRDREGTLTGSVIYAVEIHDAATNRLLSAYVTKQYPSPVNVAASMGDLTAAKAGIDKGAKALAAELQ